MIKASGPVNPRQLQAKLGGTGVLKIVGDPTAAGAQLSSEQYSDTEISDALAAVTYDPTYGAPPWKATLASLAGDAKAGTLTQAQLQAAVAALIAAVGVS